MQQQPQQHSRAARWACARLVLLLLAGEAAQTALAQLSKPVASDKHWEEQGHNKFLQRAADNDKDGDSQFEEFAAAGGPQAICPLDIELKWMTEVSSSVYATPLITDLYADGRKDVIVPGFVHYTEVLEGPDGAKALGWPGFHRSTVHASPLLYDIDLDGVRDVAVATYDGEVLFFKDNGEQLMDRLYLPRLRVRKKWFVGLHPDPIDHSHPDVGGHASITSLADLATSRTWARAGRHQHAHGHHTQRVVLTNHHQQIQQPQPHVHIPTQALPQHVVATPQQHGHAAQVHPQHTPPAQPQHAVQHTPQHAAQHAAQAHPQPAHPQPAQAHPQPAQAQPLAAPEQAAVVAFKQKLDGVEKQFGKTAADLMLKRLKETNKGMFDAVTAFIAHDKELQQLAGSFGAGGQPAHPHQRRLMSVDSTSSSSSQDDSLLEPFGTLSAHGSALPNAGRQLKQDSAHQAAAGVEADPAHKGLTQEALDSFKIFEDPPAEQQQQAGQDTAAAAAAAAGAADGAAEDAAAAALAAAAAGGGAAAAAASDAAAAAVDASGLERQEAKVPDVDEFGDAWQQQQQQPAEGAASTAGGDAAATPDWNSMWGDESFTQSSHQYDAEYVYVDAHVLATPAIADIDGDGHEELVASVSYFYDQDYYDDPQHAGELHGIDKDKYVAGGVVAFDLRTKLLKWQTHLDLTTTTTRFTAHIFSSPTLVDLDGDGTMEVVVGTSVGFVYVLDHNGQTRPGWPVQMGEVQGQVLVADLNADGKLELFAGDSLGNVALLDINGKELWERHMRSMVGQAAVAGDIDGDGLLEIVFGTADGRVHALRGADGQPLPGFPFQTGGPVRAQATLAPLSPSQPHVQHILIMSFDGFLYAIDGKSGCAHSVDIGEASYAAVLVDDLCGDGQLELLVATMNGNVYGLQSTTPYHPLKTWTAQVQGVNGLVSRWGYMGLTATPASRQLRDVAGQFMTVQLEVTDQRALLVQGVPSDEPPRGPYNVTVLLKGVGVAEMNAGPQPVIGLSDVLPKPGKSVVALPCPRSRTTAAVHLDLVTEHRLHYEDEFVVSFHMHFHKLLKWLIALPLLGMALVVLVAGQSLGYADTASYHLG